MFVAVLAAAVVALQAEPLEAETASPPPAARAETPAAGAAVDLSGLPTRITDGDTFRFGETRVRLHGMNAPELRTPDGQPARQHLQALIGGGQVRCRDTGERSYERVVAVCWSASGRELNEAMVRDGWALDAPRFSRGRYRAAEQAARAARSGMHSA